jgi:FtsP/CotA-like multicopper oxidase with cupredoxin domain
MNRREFLHLAGVSALSGVSILSSSCSSVVGTAASSTSASKQAGGAARFSLRISPVKLELAPGQTVQTIGYNGKVPGPLLRVKEGQQVTVDVQNDSDVPELVHWHGLYVPSEVDGAMGEGTPMVPPGGSRQYSFVAQRDALVSHSRLCRQRPTAQSLLRTVRILLYRAQEQPRPI